MSRNILHLQLSIICVLTSINSFAQQRLSQQMLLVKQQIGVYHERKLFGWFIFDSTDSNYRLRLVFRYADQLRIPSKLDTIRIKFDNSTIISLPNRLTETIEHTEDFSGPMIVRTPVRTVLFEISYEAIIPDTIVKQLQQTNIELIQLISAPVYQPEDWLKKFDVSRLRNYEKALDGRHETLVYGNRVVQRKQADQLRLFFTKTDVE